MKNNQEFDLDAYYKSLEENKDILEYEKESNEADKKTIMHRKEEDLGAMDALILENEAAVGFDRNQKK